MPLPGKNAAAVLLRERAEGADRCSDDAPSAKPPPSASAVEWKHRWRPDDDTIHSRNVHLRRYGRCNDPSNVCKTMSTADAC